MSTQQSGKPQKQKRTSILSGNLRIIVIILGFIFFVICIFFWSSGINNDQVNKIMSVVFTIFTAACAFLSIPFLNRSDEAQTSSSFQIPTLQINNSNNIYHIQPDAEQSPLSPAPASNNTISKDQGGTSQSNTQAQQQPSLGETSTTNRQLTPVSAIGASMQSNTPNTYPTHIGKCNILDSTLFDEMVRALAGLPATASFQGRNALLIGLPHNIISSLHRDNNSDTNDLENILTQLDGLGPLETGEQPLIIFTQNASRRAEGLAAAKSLNVILEDLKRRYGLL